ncbi:MAG: penicillin-binding protein [Erysipelotrichaceae bacterium]|nr:penicillin-binding protein [Erysipelotrichaceae bacterium]
MDSKNSKKATKPKKTKYERKKARRRIINGIMGFIVFCAILGIASGVSSVWLILNKSDVKLNPDELKSQDASLIYDAQGNEIAMLGMEDRINISYADMPQCLIDAFVAVEDSRFFEHPGFDLPRFTKAILENLSSLSFGQGGSTLTMQIIKNTYFMQGDTNADRSGGQGIARKVQEIYYSLRLNKLVPKEKILELYINKVNYGSTARGVQVAADYYFGKDAKELNLVEAAMLAGVINAPNLYNPYYNPLECQERTSDVLYQMFNHGYITEMEYKTALKVNVTDLLVGEKSAGFVDGKTIPNQAYIDAVVQELEDVYDINPYDTAVKVYTGMNQAIQTHCDNVSDGKVEAYRDAYINYSAAVIENGTGLIIGLCGGRGYDRARMFNQATDSRWQPASSAKALMTYPTAFEYAGYGTSTYIHDHSINWGGTPIQIRNDDGIYHGWVSVQYAFAESLNTCAVQTYRKVANTIGESKLADYLNTLGFDPEVANNVNEQYALGSQNFTVSPVQSAGAISMILSKGVFHKPHTITRIEYINSTKEPIVVDVPGVQVISPGAAWETCYLMSLTVNPKLATDPGLTWYRNEGLRKSYPTFGKSGTASLPDPYYRTDRFKNCWLIGGTADYAIATVWGYDHSKISPREGYIPAWYRSSNYDVRMFNSFLVALENTFGVPKKSMDRPSDLVSLTHVRGLMPFTAVPSYASGSANSTWVLSKFANLAKYPEPKIGSIERITAKYDKETNTITLTVPEYPDKYLVEGKPKETNGFNYTAVDGPVRYHFELLDPSGTVVMTQDSATNTITFSPTQTERQQTFTATCMYKYMIAPVNSNTVSTTVRVAAHIPEPDIPDLPDPEEPVTP